MPAPNTVTLCDQVERDIPIDSESVSNDSGEKKNAKSMSKTQQGFYGPAMTIYNDQ